MSTPELSQILDSALRGVELSSRRSNKFVPLTIALALRWGLGPEEIAVKAVSDSKNYGNRISEATKRPCTCLVLVSEGDHDAAALGRAIAGRAVRRVPVLLVRRATRGWVAEVVFTYDAEAGCFKGLREVPTIHLDVSDDEPGAERPEPSETIERILALDGREGDLEVELADACAEDTGVTLKAASSTKNLSNRIGEALGRRPSAIVAVVPTELQRATASLFRQLLPLSPRTVGVIASSTPQGLMRVVSIRSGAAEASSSTSTQQRLLFEEVARRAAQTLPEADAVPAQQEPALRYVATILEADAFRRRAPVPWERVLSLCAKRGIEPGSMTRVIELLSESGVEIDGAPPARDVGVALALVNEVELPDWNSSDSVPESAFGAFRQDLFRYRLLSHSELIAQYERIDAARRAGERLALPTVPASERELLERIVAEGDRAKQRVVAANLRLVVSVARGMSKAEPQRIDEYVAWGNMGLLRAVERFDHRLGTKFATYATWWIRQSIDRFARVGLIRVPVHARQDANRFRRAVAAIKRETGREPSIATIAEQTGWTIEKTQFVQDSQHGVVSLDTPVSEDFTLSDVIPAASSERPDELAEQRDLRRAMNDALEDLHDERLEEILRRRFGLNDSGTQETLEQISRTFGVTRERIRQLESKALDRLRHPSRLRILDGYEEEL